MILARVRSGTETQKNLLYFTSGLDATNDYLRRTQHETSHIFGFGLYFVIDHSRLC